jgi:hypothetical protein
MMSRQQFWMVLATKNEGRLHRFYDYEEAEDEAKRLAIHGDVYILEPVAYVKQPVPDLPVERVVSEARTSPASAEKA